MDTSKLFEDKSDLYAAARPLYPDALFAYIASISKGKECAWDCATGNGQAAIGLAKHFARITASDISDNQIANSFKDKRIHYSVESAEKTSYEDNQFDLVNVAQALHWFDLQRFWPEVKRILKPDGLFVTYSYSWSNISSDIDAIIENQFKKIIEPYWAPNNKLCWNGYAAVEFPFDKLTVPAFDLVNHWNLDQLFDYLHTWSATRRCIDEIGMSFFEQAKQSVLAVWENPNEKRIVTTPLTLIAGYCW